MANEGNAPEKPLYVSFEGAGLATDDKLEELRALLEQIESNTDDLEVKAENVNLNTDQLEAKLDALIAKDFATETTLATRASEATLASVLSAVDGLETKDYSTEATLAAVLAAVDGLEGKDFATQTTLAAVLVAVDNLEGYLDGVETLLNNIETDAAQQATLASLLTEVQALKRPSSGTGRTHFDLSVHGATADATLRTVTNGKVFYATSITVSAYNVSTVTAGSFRITDGGAAGTLKVPLSLPVAIATAFMPVMNFSITLPEPMQFSTSVFLDIIAGTLTVSVTVVGYEE